jgi:hypothetical protein
MNDKYGNIEFDVMSDNMQNIAVAVIVAVCVVYAVVRTVRAIRASKRGDSPCCGCGGGSCCEKSINKK